MKSFAKLLILLSLVLNSFCAAIDTSPMQQNSQSSCMFFDNLSSTRNGFVDPSLNMICIISYSTVGDSPPRWMTRLLAPPNPIQPWHVQTADGTYWQDSGSDFYPEFLGATVSNPDCSTALENAFRAHMYLKMYLRSMGGMYKCTRQVHFDTTSFANGECNVDFNGIGRSRISFSNDVPSPCFFCGTTKAQNGFWGRLIGLEIDANVNGIAAQFGRSDLQDPSNNFEISINVKNNSTGNLAQAVVINAFYSSLFNIIGNCGAIETGLTAIQLNRCNMCSGFLAPGHANNGLVLANYTTGNSFSVDIEVLKTGLIQNDTTCAYNEITCGVIANLTDGIDNHSGGPLRIRNVPIAGVTNIFTNPNANDASWGGCGVTIDNCGENLTQFDPGIMPGPDVWIMNKSAQPQWISIFGSSDSDPFEIRVRFWDDFSSKGALIASQAPCGFILNPGEKVCYKNSGDKQYSWAWRPML